MAFEQQAKRFFKPNQSHNELRLHIQIAEIDKLFSASSRFESLQLFRIRFEITVYQSVHCMQNDFHINTHPPLAYPIGSKLYRFPLLFVPVSFPNIQNHNN